MGNRCDDSVPKSQTHGHPDLDLWLQVSYNHTRALQVKADLFCLASSANATCVLVTGTPATFFTAQVDFAARIIIFRGMQLTPKLRQWNSGVF